MVTREQVQDHLFMNFQVSPRSDKSLLSCFKGLHAKKMTQKFVRLANGSLSAWLHSAFELKMYLVDFFATITLL